MTNTEMAENYFLDGEVKLGNLSSLMASGRFNIVVREAQETVELLLKALLRYVGIEPAKTHDVAETLRLNRNRFPDWLIIKIDEIAEISTELAGKRGLSFYGDELTGVPPSTLFIEDDARQAIEQAQFVYNLCAKLIGTKR